MKVAKTGDVEAILRLLDSPDRAVRRHAVFAIRRRGLDEAYPELAWRALEETDAGMRGTITLALAQSRDPRWRETLWNLTKEDPQMPKYGGFGEDGWNDVRRLALRGLSYLGDAGVVDLARAIWAEGGIFNKLEALDALARLDTPDSRAALHEFAKNTRNLYWRRQIHRATRRRGKFGRKPN